MCTDNALTFEKRLEIILIYNSVTILARNLKILATEHI